jgi:hypothetical protein
VLTKRNIDLDKDPPTAWASATVIVVDRAAEEPACRM